MTILKIIGTIALVRLIFSIPAGLLLGLMFDAADPLDAPKKPESAAAKARDRAVKS